MTDKKNAVFDPEWQEKYADRISTPEEAVSRLRPGQCVFIGTGCAQPQELVNAFTARAKSLTDVEIVHLLTVGDAPYAEKGLARHVRVNSFFIAANVRDVIQKGLGDYTPIFLSDIPRLFSSGRLPLDAALVQVTPPDSRGRCSLGVSVDIVKSAAENASLLVAQVNPRMPWVHGESFIDIDDIDVLVPVDEPLAESAQPEPTEVTRRIAEHVASLIEDGSTIEFGIGRIPQSVIPFLKDKRDLGIHTEMVTDAIIDLVESGAVTGERKSVDRGKIVASFCLGTRRLFEFLHDDPRFSFRPTEYVNDPMIIGSQHRMVAINVALEVDLTGQVCADSLGTKFYSGLGGQVDFNRGAARSRGGKALIALPSTAQGGKVSRIVTRLSPGGGVTTSRGDVHYVITEHGVAYLHGKSVQERAIALISIAHPSFRAQLLEEAIEAKYVHPGLADVEGKISIGPESLRTALTLDDGTQINFRPIHPTDMPRMKDLFYALSRDTVYYRFMRPMKQLPQKQVLEFVYVDHRNEVALVGTIPEAHGDEIVAVARYYLDPRTNRAEVAFVVRDAWQGRGIGTFMLRHLISVARRNGIAGFTANVLVDNRAMQAVMHKGDVKVKSKRNEGVYEFELDFE